jgi:hypothetical protein
MIRLAAVLAAAGAVAAAASSQMPELRRYMKIRSM